MLATDRFYVRYGWRRERDSFSAPLRTISNLLIPETEQTAYAAVLTQGTHGAHTANHGNPQGPAGVLPNGGVLNPVNRPGHCEDEAGGAPRGAFLNRFDRRRHCEDETPAGSASRQFRLIDIARCARYERRAVEVGIRLRRHVGGARVKITERLKRWLVRHNFMGLRCRRCGMLFAAESLESLTWKAQAHICEDLVEFRGWSPAYLRRQFYRKHVQRIDLLVTFELDEDGELAWTEQPFPRRQPGGGAS